MTHYDQHKPIRATILSPVASHPSDFGNRKRIYHLTKALQDRGVEISFILLPLDNDWREGVPADVIHAMRDEWGDVEVVVPTRPYHPASIGEDHTLDEWWDPSLEHYLQWHFLSKPADFFLVNYTFLSKALNYAPSGCVKVLDTHDKFGGRRELLESLGIGPEFFHTTIEDEARALERADVVVAIKEEEKEYFEGLTFKDVVTIPFYEPARSITKNNAQSDAFKLGMVGARNNINLRNYSKFIDVMLPKIAETFAPVEIHIAGSICTDLAVREPNSSIIYNGFVDDINDFYGSIDAVCVPMEISSGQKIKTGEALSTGLPIISHEHSFEGYAEPGLGHCFESFEEMGDAIIELSFNRELVAELAIATKKSQAAQKVRFNDAIDECLAVISDRMQCIIFTVDVEDIAQDEFLQLHFHSQVQFMSVQLKVVVAFTGDLSLLKEKFLKKLCVRAAVFVTGDNDDCHHYVPWRKIDEVTTLTRMFNVRAVWHFNQTLIEFARRKKIKSFQSLDIKPVVELGPCKSVLSSGRGSRISIGYFKTVSGQVQQVDFDLLSIRPILPHLKNSMKQRAANVDAAIFLDDDTIQLSELILKIVKSTKYKVSFFVNDKDSFDFPSTIGVTGRSRVEIRSYDEVDLSKASFGRILDLCRDSSSLLVRNKVVSNSTLEEGFCHVRFDAQSRIKLIDVVPIIRSCLEGSEIMNKQSLEYDGFEFLYNYIKDKVVSYI